MTLGHFRSRKGVVTHLALKAKFWHALESGAGHASEGLDETILFCADMAWTARVVRQESTGLAVLKHEHKKRAL